MNVEAIMVQSDLRDRSAYIHQCADLVEDYLEQACKAELERNRKEAEEYWYRALGREANKRRWEREARALYYELHAIGHRSYETLDQPDYRTHEERLQTYIDRLPDVFGEGVGTELYNPFELGTPDEEMAE